MATDRPADRNTLDRESSGTRGASILYVKPSLRFYSPKQVYDALTKNNEVKRWLNFISNDYIPEPRRVLLLYPCSADKPYHNSRSYKRLSRTLSRLGPLRHQVHLVTVSEPFGLVPEEFYGKRTEWHDWKNSWYDCPGLFEWWCRRHHQPYDKEYLEKCIRILALYVAAFFEKANANNCYRKMMAFVRTYSSSLKERDDHTHRRIIQLAGRLANAPMIILPPKDLVSNIVSLHGRLAWDLYGVSHPEAQRYLLDLLTTMLQNERP